MKKHPRLAPIAEHIIPKIFKIWIDKVVGLENLPKSGSFIIAPNHNSYIEHLLIGSVVIPHINKKMYFIAKREHFNDITQKTWHSLWEKYISRNI